MRASVPAGPGPCRDLRLPPALEVGMGRADLRSRTKGDHRRDHSEQGGVRPQRCAGVGHAFHRLPPTRRRITSLMNSRSDISPVAVSKTIRPKAITPTAANTSDPRV